MLLSGSGNGLGHAAGAFLCPCPDAAVGLLRCSAQRGSWVPQGSRRTWALRGLLSLAGSGASGPVVSSLLLCAPSGGGDVVLTSTMSKGSPGSQDAW